MALICDAVAAGGGEREATGRAAFATRERDSPLDAYSIDDAGLTTQSRCGCLEVVDGELVWVAR